MFRAYWTVDRLIERAKASKGVVSRSIMIEGQEVTLVGRGERRVAIGREGIFRPDLPAGYRHIMPPGGAAAWLGLQKPNQEDHS